MVSLNPGLIPQIDPSDASIIGLSTVLVNIIPTGIVKYRLSPDLSECLSSLKPQRWRELCKSTLLWSSTIAFTGLQPMNRVDSLDRGTAAVLAIQSAVR